MSGSLKNKLLAAAGLSSLMAVASAPATGASEPNPNPDPTPDTTTAIEGLSAENQAEVVDAIKAAGDAGKAAGIIEGTKAANARVDEVFQSDAAKANPGLAAFLLTNTDASAAKIVEQVSAQTSAPAAAAPAPAAPAAPAQPTTASMAADDPLPSRANGNDGLQADEKTELADVFPGVDFSGKSAITEDGMKPGFLVAAK